MNKQLKSVLYILGAFTFVALFISVVPPYKRGFYCQDKSIKLPFKPNTISVPMLLLLCHGCPLILIILFEHVILADYLHTRGATAFGFGKRCKHAFKSALFINVEFTLGLYIQLSAMYLIKSTLGVLRPHFLDVCQPDFERIDCTLNDGYVTEFECTTPDGPFLKYARESFPSGHASSAAYAFCFLLFYVWRKFSARRIALGASTLVGYCLWAVYVCVSRVTDNWHHASDIYGGVILGVIVAVCMFLRKSSVLVVTDFQLPRIE